jgi:hypothetical protein
MDILPTSVCYEVLQWDLKLDKPLGEEQQHQEVRQPRRTKRRGGMGKPPAPVYGRESSRSPTRPRRPNSGGVEEIPQHQQPRRQMARRRGSMVGGQSTPEYGITGLSKSPTCPGRRNSGDDRGSTAHPPRIRAERRTSNDESKYGSADRRPSNENHNHGIGILVRRSSDDSNNEAPVSISPSAHQVPRQQSFRREREPHQQHQHQHQHQHQQHLGASLSSMHYTNGPPPGVPPAAHQVPRQQSVRREGGEPKHQHHQHPGESLSSMHCTNGLPGVPPAAHHQVPGQQPFRREREPQQQHEQNLGESLSSIPWNPAPRSHGRRTSLGGSGARQDAYANSLSSMEGSGDFGANRKQMELQDRLQHAKLAFDQHNEQNHVLNVVPVTVPAGGPTQKQRRGLRSLLNRRSSMSNVTNVTDEHATKATECFDRYKEVQTKGFAAVMVQATITTKIQEPEIPLPMHPPVARRARRRSSMSSSNFCDPSTGTVPQQGGGRRADLAKSISMSRFHEVAQVRNLEADLRKQEDILLGYLLKPAHS